MAFFSFQKGKVKFYCTDSWCGDQSAKHDTYEDAYMALSVHNYKHHPNRFPRWNPNIKAIEKEYSHAKQEASG